jgi:purine-nucleoside phosphorylase
MDRPNRILTLFQRANESANLLVRGLPQELRNPKVAIICGSGLGGLADAINPDLRVETPYHDIPGFPRSTGKSTTGAIRMQAVLK